jgi:UDP-glucose 4-epimerase
MVLPRFVQAAIEGAPIQVHGDGLQARCFCDVRDVAPALPRMLGTSACHGRVFNVGSDTPVSILELAQVVKRVVGSRSPIQHIAYEEAYGGGFEDLRIRQPDLTRVRQAIDFAPRIGLQQTIADIAAQVRQAQPEGAA